MTRAHVPTGDAAAVEARSEKSTKSFHAPTLAPGLAAWERFITETGLKIRRNHSDQVPTVEILKPEHRKSAVYRLRHAGHSGENVVAKRCINRVAMKELAIYRALLAEDSDAPFCYGTAADRDQHYAWLFLADVGDVPFSLGDADHRRAAARWLAKMHRRPVPEDIRKGLPQLDAAGCLTIVAEALSVVEHGLANNSIESDDRGVLNSIASACGYITSNSGLIEEVCSALEPGLVHGDLGAKNARILMKAIGTAFVPFDWETAAWGCPAIDLSVVDLSTYREAAEHLTPGADAILDKASHVGRILWCLAPIRGERASLEADWVSDAMGRMRFYESQISAAIAELVESSSVSGSQDAAPSRPSIDAWTRFSGISGEVFRSAVVRSNEKTLICRLEKVIPNDAEMVSSIIAKRASCGGIQNEAIVYRDVLSQLPLSQARCYGLILDDDPELAWLFLEDAGTGAFDKNDPVHQRLAAEWLGNMNISAAELTIPPDMRQTGHRWYFAQLAASRVRLVDSFSNPALKDHDRGVVERILEALEVIATQWNEIPDFCAKMPRTLVHGDIAPKNMLVKSGDAGPSLFLLDWEIAAWGVPAADIGEVDFGIYYSVVHEKWPDISKTEWKRLERYGRLFRIIVAVDWASQGLIYPWFDKSIEQLISYHAALTGVFADLRWTLR